MAQMDFFSEVVKEKEQLLLRSEGWENEESAMKHIHDDTFSWLQSRNDLVRRERTVLQSAPYYQIRFEANELGAIVRLIWVHDDGLPDGETYDTHSAAKEDIEALIIF